MEMLKLDTQPTSSHMPKIFLLNEGSNNITEFEIEFFKSKPKRLTSQEIINYLTQNFSKDKESMLKLSNLKDLKKIKDIALVSLIISSLSNLIKPETNQNPNPLPPVFEIVKVTQIQSENQFQEGATTSTTNFSYAKDTDFEINADELGNLWIRNIYIDSRKNTVASNWHVYSIAGKHLAEFDNAGFKAEAYRGKVWDIIEKVSPGVLGGIAGYYTKEKIDKLEAELKEQRKEHEAKLEKKDSEIKDQRKEYEAKLEKKDAECQTKLNKKKEFWAKKMSAKEESWEKKELEKNKEIKELQFKIYDLLSKDK